MKKVYNAMETERSSAIICTHMKIDRNHRSTMKMNYWTLQKHEFGMELGTRT